MTTLGILLASDDHGRAHAALIAATGAAAIGRVVTIFATSRGCALFLDPSPLLDDPREAIVAARGVAGIGALLGAAEELGIRRIACEAGLKAEGLAARRLAAGVEVAGIVTFLESVGAGQIVAL